MPDEPMFLLTKEDIDLCGIKHVLYVDDAQAIAQAQLKKVAVWLKQHSYHYLPEFPGEASLRHATYWNSEVWDALMREAGLEKGVPDA